MHNEPRFKLNAQGALFALISAALANSALANTGRVDFTTGNVNVTHGDGRVQPLNRGAELRSGDKVVTGLDGRAQVRFSDGAYVSLQPNSEFDIKEYRYNGRTDGSESAVFSLFKGALRTVTGLVGRVNRNKYQITTPTATIGIRGTGGLISVGADGSTLVTGTSGIWSLTNNGGSLDIPAGTAGFAGANRNAPPQPSTQGPVVPPPQPTATTDTTFVQGNNVTAGGAPAGLVLTSGPGYDLAGVAPIGGAGPLLARGLYPSSAVFDGSGALTSFTTGTTTFTLASGVQNEFATNGILAWGRWTGVIDKTVAGVTTSTTIGANDGLHYVIGLPSPSMPTSGTFTYTLVAGTAPTFGNAATAPGVLNDATLVGDFTTGAITANVKATAGGFIYSGSAAGTITSSTFSGAGAATGSPIGGCSGGCTLNVNGLFAGAGAAQAGFVYQFGGATPTGTPTTLNGSVALTR